MKHDRRDRAKRWCLWCCLISIVWPFGVLFPAIWADQRWLLELPGLGLVLLLAPGCAVGLYGWGLMSELAERPAEKRPAYYRFLAHYRIRYFPFLYLFGLLCPFLMC